jgi:hypothetical protein
MILLDTDVVSEAMKPEPNLTVRNWFDDQAAETLYLSSVTIAELMFGIGALPKGTRRDKLAAALGGVLELLTDRILPFDIGAARRNGVAPRSSHACYQAYRTPMSPLTLSRGYGLGPLSSAAYWESPWA